MRRAAFATLIAAAALGAATDDANPATPAAGAAYAVVVRGTVEYGPSTTSMTHQLYPGGGPGCFATLTTTSHDTVTFSTRGPLRLDLTGGAPAFGPVAYAYRQSGSGTYGPPSGATTDGSQCPQPSPMPGDRCGTTKGTLSLRAEIAGGSLTVFSTKQDEPGSSCPGAHPAAIEVYRTSAPLPAGQGRTFVVHGRSTPYPNVAVAFTATFTRTS